MLSLPNIRTNILNKSVDIIKRVEARGATVSRCLNRTWIFGLLACSGAHTDTFTNSF